MTAGIDLARVADAQPEEEPVVEGVGQHTGGVGGRDRIPCPDVRDARADADPVGRGEQHRGVRERLPRAEPFGIPERLVAEGLDLSHGGTCGIRRRNGEGRAPGADRGEPHEPDGIERRGGATHVPWDGADRADDARRRRPAGVEGRRRDRGVPQRRADEPRPRALRRPARDRGRRARARVAARGAPARRPRPAAVRRRPPRPDPRAAAARDAAGGDRGAARRDARDRGDPRPHAPQVLRARRPGRLDGLDELDGGLLDAPGERRRPRARLRAARVRVHAGVRAALGARRRRGHRDRRSRGR